MKSYSRFNLAILTCTAFGLLAVGSVNAVIDAFGILGNDNFFGLNRLKTEKFFHTKLFKAADITRVQPRTVLLGSSRTDLGLDPAHQAVSEYGPVYNLGLVGPNMYEVFRYLEHAAANQPDLKRVVLGIDFFMFNEYKVNEVDFKEERLGRKSITPSDWLNASLSFDALEGSLDTAQASLQDDAYYLYREDGMRYVYGDRPDGSLVRKFEDMIAGFIANQQYYGDYELSEDALDALHGVVELSQQRGIELEIFISPSHAAQWEGLYEAGLWDDWEAWKQAVVEIAPVWDFSGYNTVTTEPIADEMVNYWDSSHYRKEVGDWILDRIFEQSNASIPEDFGQKITSETVNNWLTQVQEDRETWLSDDSNVEQRCKIIKDACQSPE